MRRILVALLLLAACTAGEPTFSRADLPSIVLGADDAPVGTTYAEGSSGYETVAQYAEDDVEEQAFLAIGLQEVYITVFFSPDLATGSNPSPTGSLAASYALRFDTAAHAAQGVPLIEEDVRRDGENLTVRRPAGAGTDGFGLYGTFQIGRPPGFVFAWRVGNVVQALVAAGPEGKIDEDAVRVLADRMAARARARS